ncbi:DUF507 family protein [Helicobacter canis]|uniref:Competence/damage-inducible domain protein n=1 Tax=Helicobacter canis TaxID=29419 RepID=A0A377J3F3_9HELI|nr:DUF507 family protein [Helicobacter canis]STO96898.1 competence/damage-inducible domain protein [Helicobacter canis]
MRLRLNQIEYIANKIALDLYNSSLLVLQVPIESIAKVAKGILEADVKEELAIDLKAQELLEKNQSEVEFLRVDERKLFGMIKRQIADERRFLLFWDDRYNALSHKILDTLIEKKYVQFNVNKNQIKNIIFKAIDSFAKMHDEIQDEIVEKIKNYKRKLLVGTDEYELIYDKLYEEELRKKGFM